VYPVITSCSETLLFADCRKEVNPVFGLRIPYLPKHRWKRKDVGVEVDTRVLGTTILFYATLFAVVGSVFGYLILYDLILSGKLAVPLFTWFPHYSFSTSMLLGISLSEIILWPLLLLKPDWF